MSGTPRSGSAVPAPVPYDSDAVRMRHSPGMAAWLLAQQLSLAYTSYATGRLILVGVAPDGRLFFNEQNYTRAMGLHYGRGALHVASLYQVWRLTNMLAPGEFANKAYDCVLVPRVAHTTGYLDVHELAVDRSDRVVFVASRYSCLATTDPEFSFRPIWKPPFISDLAAEDRCHLNGLAMADGVPAYVTAFSQTDGANGWREAPLASGVLIDVGTGEVVSDGFHMPHSPRVHEGAVWLLDSARGYLVRVDRATGAKEDVVFCPGFVRGMILHNGFAIIAVSKAREGARRMPLHDALDRHCTEPWCAILVVDLARGAIVEFIRYETEIRELFDVVALPGVRNAISIGPSTEELLTTIRANPEYGSLDGS